MNAASGILHILAWPILLWKDGMDIGRNDYGIGTAWCATSAE